MTYRQKLDTKDILKLLLQNKEISNCVLLSEHELEKINEHKDSFGNVDLFNESDIESYETMSSEWFIPDKYKTLNLETFLIQKCSTDIEKVRVLKELKLYNNKQLIPLLQFLIFLVDFMREHNIVWGVGRGSSLSSYILYLIGIHKINSIKYNLNIEEFLK